MLRAALMAVDDAVTRYRRWYRRLLRFYTSPFRARFAESMEQTFADLCRERAEREEGLAGFVIWVFAETSAGIIRENMKMILLQNTTRRLAAWAAVVAVLLIVPVLGNRLVDGWNWGPLDFVFAGTLLFGAGVTYDLVARMGDSTAYRAAVGIAVATGLVLVWVNAAVGIIGDGPVNLLYLGVIAIGLLGASIARFQPRGMALTLLAMALVQLLIPVIAVVIWNPPFDPGVVPVFALNGVFVAVWVVSALLFRRAAPKTLHQVVSSNNS
jgi:hypothetical protein